MEHSTAWLHSSLIYLGAAVIAGTFGGITTVSSA